MTRRKGCAKATIKARSIDQASTLPMNSNARQPSRAAVSTTSNCNAQVPAKLYEYLRAARPLVCLSDPAGDTASVVRDAGIDSIAMLDSAQDIAALLARLLAPSSPTLRTQASAAYVATASRTGRAQSLASMLNSIIATPSRP